jgi:hypothetical protein
MIYLELDHVVEWINSGVQPADFDIVTVIRGELTKPCRLARDANQQERICFECWQTILKDHDWQPSFQGRPQVIFFADIAPSCHLTALQWYLQTQCLDIDRVHVVIPTHLNSRQWWKDWCHQARTKGFKLHDWIPGENLYMRSSNPRDIKVDWQQAWQTKLATAHKTFSLFGGSHMDLDRCYLVLACSDPKFLDHGMIDFHGGYGVRLPEGEFVSRQAMADYCESITGFKDFQHVEEINAIYDSVIKNGKYQTNFSKRSYVYQYDLSVNLGDTTAWRINQNCWFNIIRETMDDHCFAMATEKTLRSFTHFCIGLPVGFDTARSLRDLGFKLYDDIIDYSYLEHHNYMHRVKGAKQQLAPYLGRNMRDYWQSHQDQFFHNAQLAWNMAQGNLGSRLQLS